MRFHAFLFIAKISPTRKLCHNISMKAYKIKSRKIQQRVKYVCQIAKVSPNENNHVYSKYLLNFLLLQRILIYLSSELQQSLDNHKIKSLAVACAGTFPDFHFKYFLFFISFMQYEIKSIMNSHAVNLHALILLWKSLL